MTTNKAYLTFQVKMNEAATSRGVAVNKGKFVIIFNKSYIKLVEYFLTQNATDEIEYIQELLTYNEELKYSSKDEGHTSFELPKNYFKYDSTKAYASKGQCRDRIDLFPIKGRNTTSVLSDNNEKPSFEYRETSFIIANSNIKIYRDGFDIDEVFMDYYRYPKLMELQDDEDPESPIIDFELELSDKFINRVIDYTVSEYSLSTEDFNKFQAEKANAIQKV